MVATVVLAWDVYKWLTQGPKLTMQVSGNMIVIGDPVREGKKWVSVTISNIGDRPTTLKGIGLKYYKSLFDRIRDKCALAAVFPNPNDNFPLPRVINPGEEWTGLVPQEREDKHISLSEMAKQGHLLIWASQSHTSKENKKRLFVKDDETEKP